MSSGKVIVGTLLLIVAAIAGYALVHGFGSGKRLGALPAAATPAGASKGKPSPLVQGRSPSAGVMPPPVVPQSSELASPVDAAPVTPTLPAAGVSFTADRKGFNNGCRGGTLTLAPASVKFTCPSDPGKGFFVSLEQIKGPNEDGIQLVSGEKYHFKVEGHDKDTMRTLFATWYARAHGN